MLAAMGIVPSKARGQNFLVQRSIAERIVAAAELKAADDVIEIGPGLGILSEVIARHAVRRLLLIEKDPSLAARLAQHLRSLTIANVIAQDFLTVDFPRLVGGSPAKVIGNLPFSVASAILRRLCEHHSLIARMVLMFQREVAERIRARPGAPGYAALSVFRSLYFDIAGHFRVSAGSFYPRPKVDAEVLVLVPRMPLPFDVREEQELLRVIRASFASPRKTLRNGLAAALAIAPSRAAEALLGASISPLARAEQLGLDDFVRLARALRNLGALGPGADEGDARTS